MTAIETQRSQIRRLLDESSPADAPTAYYALFHAAARSRLAVSHNGAGLATGFVGVFQTGFDLFRPLITLRCPDAPTAAELCAAVLTPARPYLFFAAITQLAAISGVLLLEGQRVLHIYKLDPHRFRPEINVLVQTRLGADGMPRAVIESAGGQALAGVNWQSPAFAEVFVQVAPALRERGFGQSVVAAVTQAVLASGRIPLYLVEPDNNASRALAEKLGYVDTGARQVYANAVYPGAPGAGA